MDTLHLVCPHCDGVNRLPRARLDQGPRCGACHRDLYTGTPLELDTAGLDLRLRREQLPLLVDFWAPWCAPCRTMAPAFAATAARLEPRWRLAKVDTEAHPALGARFGIRAIPTLVAFRDGRELARQSGALGEAALARWIAGLG